MGGKTCAGRLICVPGCGILVSNKRGGGTAMEQVLMRPLLVFGLAFGGGTAL